MPRAGTPRAPSVDRRYGNGHPKFTIDFWGGYPDTTQHLPRIVLLVLFRPTFRAKSMFLEFFFLLLESLVEFSPDFSQFQSV